MGVANVSTHGCALFVGGVLGAHPTPWSKLLQTLGFENPDPNLDLPQTAPFFPPKKTLKHTTEAPSARPNATLHLSKRREKQKKEVI